MKLSTQLFITTLSKTTHSLSIFILSVILSRYFTKDEYGTYLHIQLIANFAIWAFLLGIPHSVYYFLPRVSNPKKFIEITTLLIGGIAIVTALIVFVNIENLSRLLANPTIIQLSSVLFFLVLFQIPLTLFEPIMISANRVQEFAFINLIFNVSFLLTVILAVFSSMSMVDILWCLVVVFSIQSCVVITYTLYISKSLKRAVKDAEEYSLINQMQYSLPIGMSMGVVEASRYADKIIVSNQTSAEDFAVYTRGAMEIPIISILANTLDNLLMPKFVEAYKNNDTDGIITSWHSVIRLMATFIYPCCFFLICTASLLIPALFSDKYIGSVIIFQVYTLGLLTRISTFNVIIRAIGKTKAILWISLLSIFFNVVLTYVFMSWWGLIGAPIATVLTTTFMRYVYLLSITHYLKLNIAQVFPWKSLLHSFISAAIASIPLIFLIQLDINVWLNLLLMAIVYGVIYLMLLKRSLALLLEEREAVRAILPSKFSWVI
ncbi:MAG: polysaccharide biosynthesis C-terminal domain-containing protein [Colwellia sp.]